jgi:hypothetical protein
MVRARKCGPGGWHNLLKVEIYFRGDIDLGRRRANRQRLSQSSNFAAFERILCSALEIGL